MMAASASSTTLLSRHNNKMDSAFSRLVAAALVMTMTASFLLLLLPSVGVSALPIQVNIPFRGKECLYDFMDEGESMTFSIFLLSGNELRANIALDGPLAGTAEIDSGAALQKAAEKYDQSKRDRNEEVLHFSAEVDFEHLNLEDEDDDDDELHDEDADDDLAVARRAQQGDAADAAGKEETAEERRARRARDRRKALEKRQRAEQRKHKQRNKVRKEGEPDERTFSAPQSGWYRLCVTASFQTVTVEMDLRKSSELGGVDPKTRHVLTFEQKAMQEEDRLLEQDTASNEGIKDEDFQGTRDKLRALRRLLADIQNKQTQERHRVLVHAATNEHSHSRMVLSSLMETILFMLVTGFQVYTIRKWFKGAPVLGR